MTFLHWIGETLTSQFDQVPLSTARWILIAVLLLLVFWVVQLPSNQATPDDRQSKWYEDLRLWAWIALMMQIVIYSIF
jgi:hypothetical protein